MKTVVVCDSEPVAMEGLRRLLEHSNDLAVARAATTLEAAVEAVRSLQPALVVLDREFGASAVIGCLRQCRRASPHSGILVWSSTLSAEDGLRLVRAGADGAVRKTASLAILMEALRAVLNGASWLEESPQSAQKVQLPAEPYGLTSREWQILELIERGFRNQEIALRLGIRTGTVKIHVRHIFEKTGIHGRYGLAATSLTTRETEEEREPMAGRG